MGTYKVIQKPFRVSGNSSNTYTQTIEVYEDFGGFESAVLDIEVLEMSLTASKSITVKLETANRADENSFVEFATVATYSAVPSAYPDFDLAFLNCADASGSTKYAFGRYLRVKVEFSVDDPDNDILVFGLTGIFRP